MIHHRLTAVKGRSHLWTFFVRVRRNNNWKNSRSSTLTKDCRNSLQLVTTLEYLGSTGVMKLLNSGHCFAARMHSFSQPKRCAVGWISHCGSSKTPPEGIDEGTSWQSSEKIRWIGLVAIAAWMLLLYLRSFGCSDSHLFGPGGAVGQLERADRGAPFRQPQYNLICCYSFRLT